MKLMHGGPSAGITYAYDAQGRVTEMRASGNFGFDRLTTISYNEHGDKSAERETMTLGSIRGQNRVFEQFTVTVRTTFLSS